MKESVYVSLKLVAKTGEISLAQLRADFVEEMGKEFNPRIIGALCGGTTPNCILSGSKLTITEKGKESVLSAKIEPDDESSEVKTTVDSTGLPTTIGKPSEPPKPKPKARTYKTGFVETRNEVAKILYAIDKGKNVILCGPTGCGKSFLLDELAKMEKKKLWVVNCDSELDKTEIIGHHDLVSDGDGNNSTVWIRGILQMAMENGDWIVFDEGNMIRPDITSVCHQALDHRRTLTIKEHANEEVKAHPDFRAFLSMNPEYAGTTEMNKAFRRRFQVIIEMDYLPKEKEKRLLMDRTGIDAVNAENCVGIARDARKSFKEGKIPSATISTTHLLEFAEVLATGYFKPMECAEMTLNISENPDENQDILHIVKGYF